MSKGVVNGFPILFNNLFAFFQIALFNGILNMLNCLIFWQNARNCKEAGLHNGIYASAHSCIVGNLVAVYNVNFEFFVYYLFLNLFWEGVPSIICTVLGVEQKHGTGFCITEHIYLVKMRGMVAGYEICLIWLN